MRQALRQNTVRIVLQLTVAIAPPLLTACTELQNRAPAGNSEQPIDLEGRWIARNYPCDGEVGRLALVFDQRDSELRATNTTASLCIATGYELFRGDLGKRAIYPADLPRSVDVEAALRATDAEAERADGKLTLVHRDFVLLEVKRASIEIAREQPRDASSDDLTDGDSERERDGGGTNQPSSAADGGDGVSSANAGSSGASDGAAASGGGAGANPGRAGSAAAGSGGRGGSAAAGSGGRSGPVAAGSGGGGESGGSDRAPAAADDWFCADADVSCTCLQGQPQRGDFCTNKPACCFTLLVFDIPSCQCWPADSSTCLNQPIEEPDAKPIATCPPP